MIRLRRPLLLVLLALCFLTGKTNAAGMSEVYVLQAEGAINPVMASYIVNGISEAELHQAAGVIIQLDTPGGLDTSMRDIVQGIVNSTVPVVVYVSPAGARAASAGVFIAMSAHIAAMAPDTTIGAAHPVSIGSSGEVQELSPEMNEKVLNDAVSYIKSLAANRNRNVDWAEKAVRESATVTEKEDMELNVVDIVDRDLFDLMTQITGREVTLLNGESIVLQIEGAPLREIPMSTMQRLLFLISDSTVAYILLSVGLLGITLELYNPGSIIPGVAGGVCLILAFYALGTLPVNYAGVALIILAFGLFVAEVFTPSFGLLTAGGVVSLIVGSIILFGGGSSIYQVDTKAIVTVVAIVVISMILLVRAVVRGQRRRPVSGTESLMGATAIVRSLLNPEGTVFVEGEIWNAILKGDEQAEIGEKVIIIGIDGLKLTVEKQRRRIGA